MSDRELLELAAKAAGISIQRSRLDDPMWRDMLLVERHKDHSGVAVGWNPLTDDGDALRLAVKLRMNVMISRRNDAKGTTAVYLEGEGNVCEIMHGSDSDSATRRAIVRAAAEIGKGMSNG